MKEYEFWILWLMSIVMQLQIQIINKRLEAIKQSYNLLEKRLNGRCNGKAKRRKAVELKWLCDA